MLGNQPVEVFLDSKMVQLRPYGVSKGAALEAVLEACARSARESSPNESPNESQYEPPTQCCRRSPSLLTLR